MPAVVSFTVETDGRLRSGMRLGEAIAACDAATGGYPAYYMVNCAHPTHFRDVLAGGWVERIGGIRANASKMSHDELDEAPELDAGDPRRAGRGLSRADAAAAERCGCSAAAAAPTTATSARSAMPAAMPMRPEPPALRPARREDAADLARLVELASEGLAALPLGADGGAGRGRRSPSAPGARGPRRGGLLLAERGDGRDRRRGGGRARRLPDRRRRRSRSTRCRRSFRPLQALENRALGTHYVNVLATYPAFRRRGVAARLLAEAERRGGGRARAEPDRRRPATRPARRLYEALRLRRGGAGADGQGGLADSESRTWVLMLKPVASGPGEGFKSAGGRATLEGGGF